MNASINPCEDPWEWACGTWIRTKHKNFTVMDRDHERKREVYSRLRDIISSMPFWKDTDSIEWKMKALYQSCMNEEAIERDRVYSLNGVIDKLGGWMSLRNRHMSNWDYLTTLLRIYSRYGGSPFFKISVEINPINATKHIIRLKPIEFEMPIYYYTNASLSDPVVVAYMGMLQDILIHLDGLPSDSRRFSENIYGYERRIAHVISNPNILHKVNSRYETMTVLELTRSAPAVHIEEILKDYFPNSITQNTRVWVPSMTYFRDISGIVSTTDDRILNDYLIASVVRNFLPYMGQNFTLFSNMFQQKLTANNYIVPRWEFCTSALHRMIPLAVAAMLQNDGEVMNSQFDARLKGVKEIFDNIKQSLLVHITDSNWLSKRSKTILHNMISGMKLSVGLPARIRDRYYVNEYYSHFIVQSNDFFKNVLSWLAFVNDRSQMMLMEHFSYDERIGIAATIEESIIYEEANKVIAIPHYLANLPDFHNEMPIPIQYGRLGVMIGEVIADAMMKTYDGSIFLKGFLKLMDESEMNSNHYYSSIFPLECYNRKIALKNGELDYRTLNMTLLNTIKQLSGVKIAANALDYYLKHHQIEHKHYPGLETYEDEGIFLLAYIQNMCTVLGPEMKNRYIRNNQKLLPQILLQYYSLHVNYFEDYWCRSSIDLQKNCNMFQL